MFFSKSSRNVKCRSRTLATARSRLLLDQRRDRRSRSSPARSEEHTSELQSLRHLVCRLLLEKKKKTKRHTQHQPQTKQQIQRNTAPGIRQNTPPVTNPDTARPGRPSTRAQPPARRTRSEHTA